MYVCVYIYLYIYTYIYIYSEITGKKCARFRIKIYFPISLAITGSERSSDTCVRLGDT